MLKKQHKSKKTIEGDCIPVDEILASLENEKPKKMEDTLSNNRFFAELLKECD